MIWDLVFNFPTNMILRYIPNTMPLTPPDLALSADQSNPKQVMRNQKTLVYYVLAFTNNFLYY